MVHMSGVLATRSGLSISIEEYEFFDISFDESLVVFFNISIGMPSNLFLRGDQQIEIKTLFCRNSNFYYV